MYDFQIFLDKAKTVISTYTDIKEVLSKGIINFDVELKTARDNTAENIKKRYTDLFNIVFDTLNESDSLLKNCYDSLNVVFPEKNYGDINSNVLEKISEPAVPGVIHKISDLENKILTENIPEKKYDAKTFNEQSIDYSRNFYIYPKNYTQYVSNIGVVHKGPVKDAADILLGKKYVSNSEIKNNWKWSDRIKNLDSLFKNSDDADIDIDGILDMQKALSKNKYLRYKKKSEYESLQNMLRCYVS